MRVRGNLKPNALNIAKYEPNSKKVEVRLRENISEYEEIDPMTEKAVTGYEYDEYILIVDNEKDLEKKIKADFDNWLMTGRTVEINTQATLYINARNDAVDEYTQQLIEEGLL